jgi:stearoyl-CoA 9-desaturase NADPH oxidoreductase
LTQGIEDAKSELVECGVSYQPGQYGIQMPLGRRMGICQSCVLPLESGYVRDLRSGTEHRAGDRTQTCISAASGDYTIDI